MSGFFPEQPILLYPSHARRLGCEEAVLLSLYAHFADHHGVHQAGQQPSFILRRAEWRELAPFWAEDRLAELTSSLVSQGVIEAEFNANGSLGIRLLKLHETQPESASGAARQAAEPSAQAFAEAPTKPFAEFPAESQPRTLGLNVHNAEDDDSAQTQHYDEDASLSARGPAPAFGGSVGWSRPKDDLQQFFDQQEQRHQRLHEIPSDWQPSDTSYQMLAKHNISVDFINAVIDEFISYWSARDRKEVTWDPLFIRLVKKEWVKEQGRQARKQSGDHSDNRSSGQTAEGSGERYQTNHRAEKRERITRAIMDINNIDW